jgi:hypothetical protein
MVGVSGAPWPVQHGRSNNKQQEETMNTLHIEHPVTDFDTWKSAFDRFDGFRAQNGVTGQQIRRPIDDQNYVLVDLDFNSAGDAAKFLTLLQANVWSSKDNSPALVGTPQTRILSVVD